MIENPSPHAQLSLRPISISITANSRCQQKKGDPAHLHPNPHLAPPPPPTPPPLTLLLRFKDVRSGPEFLREHALQPDDFLLRLHDLLLELALDAGLRRGGLVDVVLHVPEGGFDGLLETVGSTCVCVCVGRKRGGKEGKEGKGKGKGKKRKKGKGKGKRKSGAGAG